MSTDPTVYDELAREVTEHGYFVAMPHENEPFTRIVVSSKFHHGRGYSGNSFWIANVNEQWFVGTWGGQLYHSQAPDSLGQFCTRWLNQTGDELQSDLDPLLAEKYSLVPYDHEAFDILLNT